MLFLYTLNLSIYNIYIYYLFATPFSPTPFFPYILKVLCILPYPRISPFPYTYLCYSFLTVSWLFLTNPDILNCNSFTILSFSFIISLYPLYNNWIFYSYAFFIFYKSLNSYLFYASLSYANMMYYSLYFLRYFYIFDSFYYVICTLYMKLRNKAFYYL